MRHSLNDNPGSLLPRSAVGESTSQYGDATKGNPKITD